MFIARSSHSYSGSNAQYEENQSYNNYQSSSWRSGNYGDDEDHSNRNQGGVLGSGSSRGRGTSQSRGQGRGSAPVRNRGTSRGGGSSSGGSSGTNRGYTTGTSSWSSAAGSDGGHIQSLLAATKDMDFSENWNATLAKMSTGNYGTTSSGQWNIGTSSGSTKATSSSGVGDWHSASTNRGYSTGASGSREMTLSAAVEEMSAGRWEGSSSGRGRGGGGSSGTPRDRDSWQSESWEYGSSRGRGSARGRDASRSRDSSRGHDTTRGQDSLRNRDSSRNRDSLRGRDNSRGRDASRGRDSEASDRWSTGQSGGWSDNISRGRSSASSRGQEMLQQGRDTGSSGYYSNRDMASHGNREVESTDRYMSSGRDTMSDRGYDKDPSEAVSITERAMDILKAVLGPQNYNQPENVNQEFSPNKRRRMDFGGEEDDYRRGPQSHQSDRGRDESRWGSSSHNERYSKDSDNSRWVPQSSRLDRNQEENRWGSQPRNTRHDESHGGNRWASQPQSEHFGTNFEKESWGQNSRNRNDNDFKYGQETQGKWHGAGRSEDHWGSQSRSERQGREQKTSRRGSHSQNEYFGREEEKRWESRSYSEKYKDQNDQQWSSRGYNEPPEKRRKPLLGPCPDFEKSKPKSLLGQHDKQKPKSLLGPHPDTKNPKPKPLLGSFPGHEKPKPKPLLGPYPGFDKPKPNSLLGPYPGHKQRADEESRWESQMSRRGSSRSRGNRGGRGSRGRGSRDRRHAESYGQQSSGYGQPQAQSFDDEYYEEPYGQEYQEGGWYEEPEWGSFEQYEEGGEWPPSSFDESQAWQYDDHSWQYDNQQFGQQSGAFHPPKLSVRDRLGAKKPALLGTAPSVDLVKQLLTPEERKRLSKRYGKLPVEALFCHMCNQSKFTSVDSYLMHQIGKKHVAMTRSFHAKSNTAYHLLKTDVQLELKRDRSFMTMPPAGYCAICDVPTYGSSHHTGVVANKLLHRYVKTLCCKQRFATRLAYENHRLSLKHLETDYQRQKAAEERCQKRLSDLKVEVKEAGMEEELAKVEEEEKEVETLTTSNDRIKKMWTIMMPRMNQLGKEKLPEKIISLKTLREINLRMKKPVKNSTQFVPYDPSEPVGIGNMIISTHFRCSLCSKSIDPNKESVLAHCSSEDHYKNAVRKREELLNAAKLQEEEKEKAEKEAKEKEEAGEASGCTENEEEGKEEEAGNEEEVIDDEPMEDPYEGESGDINTLLNEVEEMIGNEDDQDLEGGAGNLPEGYEDGDELIYDDGDIAEEFREVLDYNPDDMEEDLSNEEFSEKEKEAKPQTTSSRGASRRGRGALKKEKPMPKAPIRRTRRK